MQGGTLIKVHGTRPSLWESVLTQGNNCLLTLAATIIAACLAPAATAQEFYAGKSIDLMIGAQPGSGYDVYGRTLARHMNRHIPGNPAIVPKNMPGAGSARAAGFLANVAPQDGTVIAHIQPGAILGPLLDPKAEKLFNPLSMQFVGNINNGTRVCLAGPRSKIRTFEDARKMPGVFGGVAPNDSTYDYGFMHRNTTGAIFQMVTGYRGSPALALALEQGEIDGFCGLDWSSLKSQRPNWISDKTVSILIQDAIQPNAELTAMGVPHVMKYAADETSRQVITFIVSQQAFHRSFIAPPATPPDRLAILRRAFDATVNDPQFLAEAKKLRIDVAPLSGERVQEVVRNLYTSPSDIVGRARAAISPATAGEHRK